jgi:molybdenum-dependent DNA-binding transcriptional regulator ModE
VELRLTPTAQALVPQIRAIENAIHAALERHKDHQEAHPRRTDTPLASHLPRTSLRKKQDVGEETR